MKNFHERAENKVLGKLTTHYVGRAEHNVLAEPKMSVMRAENYVLGELKTGVEKTVKEMV